MLSISSLRVIGAFWGLTGTLFTREDRARKFMLILRFYHKADGILIDKTEKEEKIYFSFMFLCFNAMVIALVCVS